MEAPNVLIIILDTVRAQSCSTYGYEELTTPVFDELAEDSTLYERAVAPSPWSLPSHASIFTGQYPLEVNAHSENMVLETKDTLAQVLRDQNYQTAVFSTNPFLVSGSNLDVGFTRSRMVNGRTTLYSDAFNPQRYIRTRKHKKGMKKFAELGKEIYSTSPAETAKNLANAAYYKFKNPINRIINRDPANPNNDKGADDIIAHLFNWIDDSEKRPFFGCVNFMDAHMPYRRHAEFLQSGSSKKELKDVSQDRWEFMSNNHTYDDKTSKLLRAMYLGEINHLDQKVGEILNRLRVRDALDDTILVITSDHGELLGEWGLLGHDLNRLFAPLVEVPLLISYPEGSGTRVQDAVSLVHLRDTIEATIKANGVPSGPLSPSSDYARHIRSEFIGMNETPPGGKYEELYAELDTRSAVVYDNSTQLRHLVLSDGRAETTTFDTPFTNELDQTLEDVSDDIKKFSKIDEKIYHGKQLEHSDEVEERLRMLGYR